MTTDRASTIRAIRAGLKRRSGKTWSVPGGRGTAWGWLRISAPPKRLGCAGLHRMELGAICLACGVDRWDKPDACSAHVCTPDCGAHYITPTDRKLLAELLGLERVHPQGVQVANSSDCYREYIDRAEGRTPSVIGEPYWD
jgi:hypothetical protein